MENGVESFFLRFVFYHLDILQAHRNHSSSELGIVVWRVDQGLSNSCGEACWREGYRSAFIEVADGCNSECHYVEIVAGYVDLHIDLEAVSTLLFIDDWLIVVFGGVEVAQDLSEDLQLDVLDRRSAFIAFLFVLVSISLMM